jgi:glycosyltransferase involved in cell wall biosynthesis
MKRIHVFGPFRGPTGYDHVVRNIVQRLYFKGVVVGLHEFSEWSGIRIPTNVLFSNMEKSAPATHSNALLAFCLPEQIHKHSIHHDKIIANYTMMETDRIPRNWVDYGALTDLIIVPTEFNRQGWIDSGVNANRIEVVPLGIDHGFYNPDVDPIALYEDDVLINDRYAYRFMNIQEIVDRKNLDGLLRS